jgi:hypothetical protein
MASLAVLGACSRPQPQAAAPPPTPPSQQDYATPPELSFAIHARDGGIELDGNSLPKAVIHLASPDHSALSANATEDGRWRLSAPLGSEPRLYSLSETFNGRLLRARGYIAALPAPGAPAVTLRPGTAAEPLAGLKPELRLSAVDFDRSGAGVVAGLAKPGQAVSVMLDGVQAGEGRANAEGVFTIPLSVTLTSGAHSLSASSGSAMANAEFDAVPAAPIARPPFTASRGPGSWRIDWMTPGGGVQTTVLFDPSEPRT